MAARLTRPLLLVGCGKMGGAMLDGWLSSGIATGGVMVVDPMATERPGVALHQDASTLPDDLAPEVVVLAVKPQQMDAMLSDYARFAGPDCLFVSVAAGKTLAYFEATLGPAAAIVRAMPNTPAAIGQGITVACPNANATAAQSAMAEALLGAVGEAVTVPDEGLMDAVTALSGVGPAYTFLLIETMEAAGEAAGLPKEQAARLALVTVAGAGQLALASDTPPSTLRENVTSPGGTTLEALKVLMRDGDGLPDRMVEAIAAATNRSRELGG
jgi:pyrroline-5-carboxylate reductase